MKQTQPRVPRPPRSSPLIPAKRALPNHSSLDSLPSWTVALWLCAHVVPR